MGAYDYLKCDLPLPAGQDEAEYTTKDTDTQFFMRHTITSGGRLVLHDGDDFRECSAVDQEHDGDIVFRGDETYRATFRGGDCVEICQRGEHGWKQVWARPAQEGKR